MGLENDNSDGDADMNNGVVQSDVAAEDPGRETRKRAVGILFYLITYMGAFVPAPFHQAPTLVAADAMHTFHSHLQSWPLS